MDQANPDRDSADRRAVGPLAIVGLIGLFVVGGGIAYSVLSGSREPIPPEIAADPQLVRGREIYLERCVACHGPRGQGDGPLAKSLTPRPRNLANDPWKYGDKPEQVLTVLAEGVKTAQMPGWAGTYDRQDLKAIAAYVYQIAGKPVPEDLKPPKAP